MLIKELFLSRKEISRIDLVAIISHVLSVPGERVLMEPERNLDASAATTIERLIGQRRAGRPLAYLTNRREFFSESFYVDERVLIPRPETELLVEEALKIVRSHGPGARVLDMGTGSGIIGALLAKGGAGRVLCVDISPCALSVARKNAGSLGVGGRIDFLASDLFSGLARKEAIFDLICANLPYVGDEEWDGLMTDVRGFEPRLALVGGRKGTELYERFIEQVVPYLAPGGHVLCEIGGAGQAPLMERYLRAKGFDVAILHDLAGQQRVMKGSWTSLS